MMKTTKTSSSRLATHAGTCQICGHSQKLPKGVLSLHGYTKRWGFFSGTCPGSRALPFEQSINLIEAQIERCKTSIEHHEAEIEVLRDVTGNTTWVEVYVPATSRYSSSTYVWKQVEVTVNAYGAAVANYETINANGQPVVKSTGFNYASTVAEAVAYGNAARTKFHMNAIAQLRSYIAWQTERTANWKPSELKALDRTADRKGPLVHLRGSYYSKNAHACAASAMAAQQYRPTTTDVDKVTCSKCKARIEAAKAR